MQIHNITAKAEVLLVVCTLALFYLPGLSSVEFHPDESQWIATSNVFETYLRGDFQSSLWDRSYWTLTQPPVVRYIIGFSRYVGGYHILDLNKPWDFERGRNFNYRREAVPSDGLLSWSRLPMAILAIFSLALVFVLLRSTPGRFAAYIWIMLVLANPYFLLHLRRAMGESSLLFFTILGTYLFYRALDFAEKNDLASMRHTFIWLGAAGISIGLAGASKLNGLASLGAVILIAFLCAWNLKASATEKLRFALTGSLLVSLVCIVIFISVNPFLWPDPVGRTIEMFQNRMSEMNQQIVIYSADYIGTWPQRLQIFPIRIFENYAALQTPFIINAGLFILGLWLVSWVSWQSFVGKDGNAVFSTLLVSGLFAAVPPLFTTIDWDRYYLFPVFFSTIFIAIALGWIGRGILSGLSNLSGIHLPHKFHS